MYKFDQKFPKNDWKKNLSNDYDLIGDRIKWLK